jgi:hypothetical protein
MVYTKIDEFLSSNPAPAKPKTNPGTKPGTSPGKTPSRPSPIRRDKPSVNPKPLAKAGDVVKRFMEELRNSKDPIKFDLGKLKERYEND